MRAAPIDKFVDATGAGDLFAAGFMVGLARGQDHRTSAQLGALAAAEVIQHLGARPEVSLKDLAEQNGLALYGAASSGSSMQPLKVSVVPVTPFQQNCSIVACTATNRAAIVDPGGDVASIRAAIDQLKVTPEKILLTHGHIDHAGGAAALSEALSIPIEGPDERRCVPALEPRSARRALRHHRCAQRHADALARRRRDSQRRRPDVQRAACARPHARAIGVRQCAVALRAGRRHAVSGFGRAHRFSLWRP